MPSPSQVRLWQWWMSVVKLSTAPGDRVAEGEEKVEGGFRCSQAGAGHAGAQLAGMLLSPGDLAESWLRRDPITHNAVGELGVVSTGRVPGRGRSCPGVGRAG